MKWMRIAAAVSTLAFVGSASGLAFGQECKQTCNTSYQQCLSSGRAENACLTGWHQCKSTCTNKYAAYTPVRAVAPAKAPAAAPAKSVAAKRR